MRTILKSTFILLMFLFTMNSCVQKEENQLAPSITTERSLIPTFGDEHKEFDHSADEVDAMILQKFGSVDYTLEEKMDLLSEMIKDAYQPSVATPRSDQYLLVAQAFVDGVYRTDVRVSHGLPSTSLRAIALFLVRGTVGFGGANANIYLNGTNIQGNIQNTVNKNCDGDKVRVKATVILQPDGARFTIPRIDCD